MTHSMMRLLVVVAAVASSRRRGYHKTGATLVPVLQHPKQQDSGQAVRRKRHGKGGETVAVVGEELIRAIGSRTVSRSGPKLVDSLLTSPLGPRRGFASWRKGKPYMLHPAARSPAPAPLPRTPRR